MARDLEKFIVLKLIHEAKLLKEILHSIWEDSTMPRGQKASEINKLTTQIRDLHFRRLKQYLGKSRAKHRIEGKSPTKFWVNLHKPKTPQDLIPAFEKMSAPGETVSFEMDGEGTSRLGAA
ncbi:hypothetical protein ACG7TL_000995 [Trametes sanguinea]